MRLVKLSIQWGQAAADKQPPGTVPLNPSLSDRRLASTSWHQLGSSDSTSDASMGLLSTIEMLPSTLESDAQSWSPPLVLIVRSHVGSPDSPYQETQSTIDRWQVLTDQKQSVHPGFLSLGGQRQNSAPELPVRPAYVSGSIHGLVTNGPNSDNDKATSTRIHHVQKGYRGFATCHAGQGCLRHLCRWHYRVP